MPTFANPLYFLLLLPVAAACWFVYRRRVREGLLFSAAFRIPNTRHTWRTRAALVLPAIYILGLVLAVVALARPRIVLSRSVRNKDVIAIMMVVDISGSMEALDLTEGDVSLSNYQTRLDVVKKTFAEFIGKRPDDLIGLVTFGGYATTRSPLTADHAALQHILGGVEIPNRNEVVDQEELATAIGDGLATACGRLEKVEPKSRIVVLLSDGESNAGVIKPAQAVKVAKELGIKVYTIGIGSASGRALALGRDLFGRKQIVPARFRVDEHLLKDIAEKTSGCYFNVRDTDGLEKALAQIDALEKTKVEQEVYQQYNELFPWVLAPGMCLIVLGTGLNMMVSKRIV